MAGFCKGARIEANRRMNETLEAMARAIFKSWFVDLDPVRARAGGREPAGMDAETAALFPDSFEEEEGRMVPRGWEICALNDLMKLAYGKALKEVFTMTLTFSMFSLGDKIDSKKASASQLRPSLSPPLPPAPAP